jgi:peptidoglycan/xylan/chitin deacetylase (PgdA/CDA1 family)
MARAVLTFHSIDDSGSVLSFPTRAFSRLIERIAAAGIPVVPFAELLQRGDGVTITFDDGMRTVHERALPVLRDHGFAAHLFLATGSVGKDNRWSSQPSNAAKFDMLDWGEIEDCVRSGFRVECHTVTHPDLRGLPAARVLDECSNADDEIERRIGRRPTLMAFPYGLFDEAVVRTVAPRYTGCFTTRLGYLGRAIDLARVPRLDSYYLQASLWNGRLLSAPTRAYVTLRASIRGIRGTR